MSQTTSSQTAPRRASLVREDLAPFVDENQEGETCLNNYILKQELGQGAFGRVYLAQDKNNESLQYAIKEFSKNRLRKKENLARGGRHRQGGWRALRGVKVENPETTNPLYLIRDEVAILKKLSHPNIVQLFEVLDDTSSDSIYMVFELCKKGVVMDVSVIKKAKPFPPDKARRYFREMILGVEYLHENGIIHRDIKPDNLLLSEDESLKIVDFGVSEIFPEGNDKTTKPAGSPAFMAPELCGRHGEISGKATDIWSMGVTLYCLLFGYLPFLKDSVIDLYECIRNDPPEISESTDPRLKDLLLKLLAKGPANRITITELREHPWVTNDGADPLISREENCAAVVDEITEDERYAAIRTVNHLALVLKAITRFKRRSMTHLQVQEVTGQNAAPTTATESESHVNAGIDRMTNQMQDLVIKAAVQQQQG